MNWEPLRAKHRFIIHHGSVHSTVHHDNVQIGTELQSLGLYLCLVNWTIILEYIRVGL